MSDSRKPVVRRFQKKSPSIYPIHEYVSEIKSGNRAVLAKAITFIESNESTQFQTGQNILKELLPITGNSVRIGITGVPGAGKSTFIERFGTMLCEMGKKVAVLAIDPSSPVSKGSILGDKTRMEKLSTHPNAFIRPSPSGQSQGGVHRKTRETILLCEAAGFDVIIVETIGVGQSETTVRTMVDLFWMLAITGAGDDLQGMKKGIMELCDSIFVTKADGDNLPVALKTKNEYNQMLRFLKPSTPGWTSRAYTCSAITGEGIHKAWEIAQLFVENTKASGVFFERRKNQTKEWLNASIKDQLNQLFFENETVKAKLNVLETAVVEGRLPVALATTEIIEQFILSLKLK